MTTSFTEDSNPGALPIRQLARLLKEGDLTSETVLDGCLQLANKSKNTFVSIDSSVIESARNLDLARNAGKAIPVLSGIPLTLKDLFDVKGQKTRAGSLVLDKLVAPAQRDCDVVGQLRDAGFLFLGRTNMSEFAFSGMGLNPHYGNCESVWDRQTGRLPGGSSSGSAVSVAEGIVPGTMGSDTAGSCRIPAAFNGITGVKPSYGRLSLKGVFPLSPSSDAPGPLAVDVDSCYVLDQVMTNPGGIGIEIPSIQEIDPRSITALVPESVVLDVLDDEVQLAFEKSVQTLKDAGVNVIEREMPAIDECVDMFNRRAVALYEAWCLHKDWLNQYGDQYDPFVAQRMKNGSSITQEIQDARYEEKRNIGADFNAQMQSAKADVVLYPTVACVPPTIASTFDSDRVARINLRCLRNTSTANYFNGCSMSLPCHRPGEAPVGLMVSAVHGADERLYEMASAMESILGQEIHSNTQR